MLQPDSRDRIVKIIMLVQLFNLAPAPLDGSHAFKKDLSHDPRGLWERWKVTSSAWLLLNLHLCSVCSVDDLCASALSVTRADEC